jgi:DNA-binding LacI/PurR family transcriptional regulator
MSDVARRAGVSRQLVSLVLRHEAGPSAASREAVLAAVADLGFQANTSAQLLRQERTRLIGVMFEPRITFESRFVERLLERAARERLGVVLGPVTRVRTTDVVVTELLGHRVEALGCFNPDPSSAALRTAIARMPVIWLGERSVEPRVDAVHSDDVAGLRLLVEHLVGLGHRDIAYAGGLGGRVGPDRADAYRRAMAGAGLGDRIDQVVVGFGEEDGAAAATLLLARDHLPTAVIGCSDHVGAALIAVFSRAGVRVPEDVSVTGYDDSDIAALSYHDLTAVRQDADLSAAEALRAMTRRLEDPSAAPLDVATPATLTVRGSTGPARTRTAQDGGGRPGSRME